MIRFLLLSSLFYLGQCSYITNLTDTTFYKHILDNTKHVFVQMYDAGDPRGFFFEPTYEKIAEWFKDEEQCTVAELNIYEYRGFISLYGIKFKPKWFFFPAENASDIGIEYKGPKTAPAVIDFLNENCGTSRLVGGKVDEDFGRIPSFNVLAKELSQEIERLDEIYAEKVEEATDLLESETDKESAQYYIKVMKKIKEKGEGHLDKESARLQKFLDGYLLPEKRKLIQKKVNILNVFKRRAPAEDKVEGEEEEGDDDWGNEDEDEDVSADKENKKEL